MCSRFLPWLGLVCGASASIAGAQGFTTWYQSPTRLEYWYALDTNHVDWQAHRIWAETNFPTLPIELASITSAEENSFVSSTVTLGSSSSQVFIGLTDIMVEGTDVWTDQTPVSYVHASLGAYVHTAYQDAVTIQDVGFEIWNRVSDNDSFPAVFGLVSPDCDSNGLPDAWEIALNPTLDPNGNGVLDICESLGTVFCQSTQNSSGSTAQLTASGSAAVAANDFYLHTQFLPHNEYGYFLLSAHPGFVAGFGGGQGNLCLGQPIIRLHEWPGSILNSGATGTVQLQVDLPTIPQGTVISPGATWRFQYWTRDVFTHNTSNGVAVTFR